MANILAAVKFLTTGLLYREVLADGGHKVFVALSGKKAIDYHHLAGCLQ